MSKKIIRRINGERVIIIKEQPKKSFFSGCGCLAAIILILGVAAFILLGIGGNAIADRRIEERRQAEARAKAEEDKLMADPATRKFIEDARREASKNSD